MMFFLNRKDALFILRFAAVLLLVFPLAMDSFRLNLMGKYLTYGFVALGLVLC
jgi:urea transport system permease protein